MFDVFGLTEFAGPLAVGKLASGVRVAQAIALQSDVPEPFLR